MSKGDNMFIKLRWKDALREILVETGQRKGARLWQEAVGEHTEQQYQRWINAHPIL